MAATGVSRSAKRSEGLGVAPIESTTRAPAVSVVVGVEEDQPEARVDDAEVDPDLVEPLVEELGKQARWQGRWSAWPARSTRGLAGCGWPRRSSAVWSCQVRSVPAVGRKQSRQDGVLEREPLPLEVRSQGGKVLGHVAVAVDDRMTQAGCGSRRRRPSGLIYAHYSHRSPGPDFAFETRTLVPYDMVIRNGTVVDGSGLGSYRADVGISGRPDRRHRADRRARRSRRSTPRATS